MSASSDPNQVSRHHGVESAWQESLLGQLTPSAQAALRSRAVERVLPAGTTSASEPLLVLDGLMRVFCTDGARHVTVRYAGRGDVTGIPAALGLDAGLRIQSLAPTRLYVLDAPLLRECLLATPRDTIAATRAVAEGHASILGVLSDHIFLTVRERVIRHLLERAHWDATTRRAVHETSRDIADAIASVATVVGRVLGVLEWEGALTRRSGRVTAVDAVVLHQLLRGAAP